MWCAICKKEVAAEVIGSNEPRCSYCGTTISSGPYSRPRTRTQKARDLLEKWSQNQPVGSSLADTSALELNSEQCAEQNTGQNERVTSKTSPTMPAVEEVVPTVQKTASTKTSTDVKEDRLAENPKSKNLPVYRFDRPHPAKGLPEMETISKEVKSSSSSPTKIDEEQPISKESSSLERKNIQLHSSHLLHSAHLEVPKPHFQIPTETEFPEQTSDSNITMLAGYMMSYLGVLGLLSGTVLIVVGYFKGPLNYMPMGWIINAFGQLLLFLGIVTLVTSKMDRMKSSLIAEFHYIRQHLRPQSSSTAQQSESSNDSLGKTEKAA